MLRLGLGEILLVLLVLFVVAPLQIPQVFRKLGEYFAALKKMKDSLRSLGEEDTHDGKTKQPKQPGKQNTGDSREHKEPQQPLEDDLRKFEQEILFSLKLQVLKQLEREYDYSSTDFVLKLLFDGSMETRQKAADLLTREPVFSFGTRCGGRKDAWVPVAKARSPVETLFAEERLETFTDILSRVPYKFFRPVMPYLAVLPGIENLDLNRIFQGNKRELYDEFQLIRKEYFLRTYPPQITVCPTYECNLNCSYCFTHELKKRYPKDMDIDSFKSFLDTINPDGEITRVSLFGGEPTILKGLAELINEVEARSMYFYFSTNGILAPAEFAKLAARPSLQMLTFHIERDDFYTPVQFDNLLSNISAAQTAKKTVILRYNLQNPEQRNWEFLDTYFKLLPKVEFSFSVVFPSSGGANQYIGVTRLRDFKPKILSLIEYVAGRYNRERWELVFAKPYPLCFFNESELHEVLRYTHVKNICEIDKNGSTNNILINPDGSYHPCMALTDDTHRFESLQPLDRLPSEYYTGIENLMRRPLLEECRICSLHTTGVCQAACYAYIYDKQH